MRNAQLPGHRAVDGSHVDVNVWAEDYQTRLSAVHDGVRLPKLLDLFT